MRHHGLGQLVGAGSRLVAAEISQKFRVDIFGVHAFAEFGDCLEMPVTAALERDIVNTIFGIALKVNEASAGAACFVSNFHYFIS